MKREQITAEELRELVHYDPLTGIFTWRVDRRMGRTGKGHLVAAAGKEIGDRTATHCYPQVNIRKRVYLLHRLAFLYVTGAWPVGDVDHMNGNRGCNVWANLRDVPRAINAQNLRRARSDSKLGVQGVQVNRHGKFVARVSAEGKTRNIGTFDDVTSASSAYVTAKRELHPGCTI